MACSGSDSPPVEHKVSEKEVQIQAYQFWTERGRPVSTPAEQRRDWTRAERKLGRIV